jgi:hypothetical protein
VERIWGREEPEKEKELKKRRSRAVHGEYLVEQGAREGEGFEKRVSRWKRGRSEKEVSR